VRILVTGSRDWPYPEIVHKELDRVTRGVRPVTIVEGACPTGADNFACDWVRIWNYDYADDDVISERHPADWAKHGKAAGFIRNQGMVDLGADLCLAFVYNQSRGASDCLNRATTAGIPRRVIDLRIHGGK
jgi:hypothetical protein